MTTKTLTRQALVVTFQGREWEVVPASRNLVLLLRDAVRSLDHVGSLHEALAPRCSAFQCYSYDAGLLAAAVSCGSQWIDTFFFLNPV